MGVCTRCGDLISAPSNAINPKCNKCGGSSTLSKVQQLLSMQRDEGGAVVDKWAKSYVQKRRFSRTPSPSPRTSFDSRSPLPTSQSFPSADLSTARGSNRSSPDILHPIDNLNPSSLNRNITGHGRGKTTIQEEDEGEEEVEEEVLTRVFGSVLDPLEEREKHRCWSCGNIFQRDATIYPDPRAKEDSSLENVFYCKECFSSRYSKGNCENCQKPILGDEKFVMHNMRSAIGEPIKRFWHKPCCYCHYCETRNNIFSNPTVDPSGFLCCESCFDKGLFLNVQQTPIVQKSAPVGTTNVSRTSNFPLDLRRSFGGSSPAKTAFPRPSDIATTIGTESQKKWSEPAIGTRSRKESFDDRPRVDTMERSRWDRARLPPNSTSTVTTTTNTDSPLTNQSLRKDFKTPIKETITSSGARFGSNGSPDPMVQPSQRSFQTGRTSVSNLIRHYSPPKPISAPTLVLKPTGTSMPTSLDNNNSTRISSPPKRDKEAYLNHSMNDGGNASPIKSLNQYSPTKSSPSIPTTLPQKSIFHPISTYNSDSKADIKVETELIPFPTNDEEEEEDFSRPERRNNPLTPSVVNEMRKKFGEPIITGKRPVGARSKSVTEQIQFPTSHHRNKVDSLSSEIGASQNPRYTHNARSKSMNILPSALQPSHSPIPTPDPKTSTCNGCGKGLFALSSINNNGETRFLTLRNSGEMYHLECFRCGKCGLGFEDKGKGRYVEELGWGAVHVECSAPLHLPLTTNKPTPAQPAPATQKPYTPRTYTSSFSSATSTTPVSLRSPKTSITTSYIPTVASRPSYQYTPHAPSPTLGMFSQETGEKKDRTSLLKKFGGLPPCPSCLVPATVRETVTGPKGQRWHASCLRCSAGGTRGVGCGKSLDSGARTIEYKHPKGDTAEKAVCRECFGALNTKSPRLGAR